MKPSLLEFLLVGAALLAPATAQSVTNSLVALTPLTVSVTDGGQVYSQAYPSGPLPTYGNLYTFLPWVPSGAAYLQWTSYAGENEAVVRFTLNFANQTLLPTYAGRIGPLSLMLEFDSTIAFVGNLQVRATGMMSAGTPWPQIDVDIDGDGVMDVLGLDNTYPVTRHETFNGVTPWRMRLDIDASSGDAMGSYTEIEVALRPDNDLTATEVVAACSPISTVPFAQASFSDYGVDFRVPAFANELPLLVLGLAPQPTLLSLPGALPCVVLPSPDAVLFAPNGAWHMPLPASLRPVTFYAQSITLVAVGLRATAGYAIQAN